MFTLSGFIPIRHHLLGWYHLSMSIKLLILWWYSLGLFLYLLEVLCYSVLFWEIFLMHMFLTTALYPPCPSMVYTLRCSLWYSIKCNLGLLHVFWYAGLVHYPLMASFNMFVLDMRVTPLVISMSFVMTWLTNLVNSFRIYSFIVNSSNFVGGVVGAHHF